MRKIITITLLILISFSLFACKKTGEDASVKEKKDGMETVETGEKGKEPQEDTQKEDAQKEDTPQEDTQQEDTQKEDTKKKGKKKKGTKKEDTQKKDTQKKDTQKKDTQKKEENKPVNKEITATEGEKHPFATQNYIYKKWKKGVMQISKETGKRKRYEQKKVWKLAYVTEDMLYYKSGDEKKTILYGVPIVKKSDSSSKGTTELDFKNKKEILSEEGGWLGDVYVASDYILYLFRDDWARFGSEEAAYAIKYTKKTGKKEYFEMESDDYDICYAEKDRFVFSCVNQARYYCLDLNTDKMTHFATKSYDATEINPDAGCDGFFFYAAAEEQIMVYDIKNKKDRLYVSKGELKKICKKLTKSVKKGKYLGHYLADMFCYEGKLYIQVQLDWEKGKTYHMNYVMLSVDLTKEKKVSYEKGLTKVMQDNSEEVSAWGDEYNSGRFVTIVDGVAILALNDSEWGGDDEQQIATYNMKTKELKKVREGYSKGHYMVGYYLAYSDSTDPYYFVGDYMDYMPDEFDD